MLDQANGLREKMKNQQPENPGRKAGKKTRVLAVTSGKGGVGKSNFALNFALSLIEQNKKVLIFDVDLGFANIEVLLGLMPRETIATMIEKDLAVQDIIEEGPNGLLFISGGNGFNELFQMNDLKLEKFFKELGTLHGKVDYIILDTGAGLSYENLRFILAADDVILLTTPEPTSVTDAYSVVKMVQGIDPNVHLKLVVNQCISEKEGQQTADNFKQATEQFLGKEIGSLGCIPSDARVPEAVKRQQPLLLAYPNSESATAIRQMASGFLQLPLPYKLGLKGFIMKILFK
ncbi:MinD/ParA family protein [Microbacterium sp. APC 3898]|uniref:MinD/ParA family protein n=1 Tax=Planococcus notacanthi TaxID=3035188 RepID=A0ABT7ZL72_9BACL|nr:MULTISPECIES: MinD/ParA family protein [Terrabacteria group]MDN3427912.1 MinD/ParA family protein [Planococcus sp. APC 4016]MDN3498553.1 MinD/ParA family protein [Microbacterium sp. APC 3898]